MEQVWPCWSGCGLLEWVWPCWKKCVTVEVDFEVTYAHVMSTVIHSLLLLWIKTQNSQFVLKHHVCLIAALILGIDDNGLNL